MRYSIFYRFRDTTIPTGRAVEMPQRIDDFTIVLPELTDIATCEFETYDGLDRLWRMVERYKITAPVAIRVVDNKARCVRANFACGLRTKQTGSCCQVSAFCISEVATAGKS
jgi:hypothetical protein